MQLYIVRKKKKKENYTNIINFKYFCRQILYKFILYIKVDFRKKAKKLTVMTFIISAKEKLHDERRNIEKMRSEKIRW